MQRSAGDMMNRDDFRPMRDGYHRIIGGPVQTLRWKAGCLQTGKPDQGSHLEFLAQEGSGHLDYRFFCMNPANRKGPSQIKPAALWLKCFSSQTHKQF